MQEMKTGDVVMFLVDYPPGLEENTGWLGGIGILKVSKWGGLNVFGGGNRSGRGKTTDGWAWRKAELEVLP